MAEDAQTDSCANAPSAAMTDFVSMACHQFNISIIIEIKDASKGNSCIRPMSAIGQQQTLSLQEKRPLVAGVFT
jgi:hypothetical protein